MLSIQKGKLDKLIQEELEKYLYTLIEQKLKKEEHFFIKKEPKEESDLEDTEEVPNLENEPEISNDVQYEPDPEVLRKIVKMLKSSLEGGN